MRNLVALITLAFSCSIFSSKAQVTPGGVVTGVFNTDTSQAGYAFQVFNGNTTLGIDSWSRVNASAEAYGNAQQLGVLKSLVMASRENNRSGNYARATVNVGFQDTITISDPMLNGQTGTYVGTVHLEMDHAGYGSQDFGYYNTFGLAVGSSIDNARGAFQGGGSYAMYYRDYLGQAISGVNVTLEFEIPFTYGISFGIGMWMHSDARTGSGENGAGQDAVYILHDATNTAEWGGTVAVRDNLGNVLDPGDYTMTSGSGTDYSQAIPEPTTCVMFALGALSLFKLRRRRI